MLKPAQSRDTHVGQCGHGARKHACSFQWGPQDVKVKMAMMREAWTHFLVDGSSTGRKRQMCVRRWRSACLCYWNGLHPLSANSMLHSSCKLHCHYLAYWTDETRRILGPINDNGTWRIYIYMYIYISECVCVCVCVCLSVCSRLIL
jgi:hypothetical protein